MHLVWRLLLPIAVALPHTVPLINIFVCSMPNRTRAWIQRGALFLLGLILAEIWQRETPCENDPLVKLKDGTVVSPCDCFSETYFEAKEKFRQAVNNIKDATLYSFLVYQEGYTMDIAVIKGRKRGTVVHTSGYHGVEGYAGSAIQVAWLQAFNDTRDIPTVILAHALNPYGMATFRRTNEHNVDLNRNGLHNDEWMHVLSRDPNIGNYQDFDEVFFNPRRAPTWFDRYVQIYIRGTVAIAKYGLPTLKRAMVSGQYHYPKGIFYGGNKVEPSLQILWDFLQANVPKKQTVTMVNVHTGLGVSGQDTIMASSSSGISPQELSNAFTNSSIPSLTQAGTAVAAGYDLAKGTAEHFFSRLFSKQSDWIVTQEFGTVPMLFVGTSLIMENMARQYLPESQAIQWTTLTREAFYKRTPKWRKDVLVRGLRVLNQAIDRTLSS